ncbi:MAG: hypothetical protein IPL78_22950 [Chloroflexi bacterium]|nr:hypothetical protein [Chloroflexota bacterium]
MWQLTLFGAPTLEHNGRNNLTRRKARALLAYLAVTQQAPKPGSSRPLLLWPDHDEQQGRADLSRILSNLRRVLGADYILADRQQVALPDIATLWVDVVHFRQQLDACRETAIGQ